MYLFNNFIKIINAILLTFIFLSCGNFSALALNEEENKSLEKDNSINDVSIYNEESLISDRS